MNPATSESADLPITPESVTVEWLTDVLRRSNCIDTETSVAGIEWQQIAEDVAFTSSLFRFSVRYSAATHAPNSFVGKFQNGEVIPERWLHLVRKEVCFYGEVEDPGVGIPRCHFAGIDALNHVFLLLEDLGSEDGPDQLISATREQSAIVIGALARLHAKWWNHSDLAGFSWLGSPGDGGATIDQTAKLTEFVESVAEFNFAFAESCPHTKQMGEILLDFLQASPAQVRSTNATGNSTLRHGDVRLDNLRFVGSDVVFFDWQLVGRGPAVADLTFWLCCNYRPEDRRACEQDILEEYSRELKKHGVDYPLKKLKADIRFQLIGRCLDRVGSFSVISETLFAGDRGKQFLAYDLQGLEGMLVDYKVVRYCRVFGFFLLSYIKIRRLLGL